MQSWQNSLACELRDYPEWHKGRQRYAVWALSIESEAILQRLRNARQLLGDWLHPAGERQAHITVFVCGFPTVQPQHNDDFSQEQLDLQLNALAQLNVTPFQLQVCGAASFSSAAYLEVKDQSNTLMQIRSALSRAANEIRQSVYTPHLTIGLYQKSIERVQIEQQLALIEATPLAFEVTQLHYATYQASAQHGSLNYEQSWSLNNS